MMLPKTKTPRDPSYLQFIREHDCFHCMHPAPSDPSHFGGKGHSGGMGLKCSDYFTAPLCRTCHRFLHQHGVLPAYQFSKCGSFKRQDDKHTKEDTERWHIEAEIQMLYEYMDTEFNFSHGWVSDDIYEYRDALANTLQEMRS